MKRLSLVMRHPLKAHGREAVQSVNLIAGQSMPWNRVWAVTHEAARTDAEGWHPCTNFTRAAGAPELMAITACLDEESEELTLRHPKMPDLTFHPDHDRNAFLDWAQPLMPAGRAGPTGILRLSGRGFTDSDFPSVSLCNPASHQAVANQLGQTLSRDRWRGNMWIDGLLPWEEFDWAGRDITVGDARLHVREPISRCLATAANPETGERDADTLGALDHFNDRQFGVCATVVKGGRVRTGDTLVVH